MKKNMKSKPLVVIQCYEDRQPTLPLRKAEHLPSEIVSNNNHVSKPIDIPPPPPPMPNTNGHQNGHLNGHLKNGDDHKAEPKNLDKEKNGTKYSRNNGTILRTPTPDYNSNKIETVAIKTKNFRDEKAEIESLESFKLRNPSNIQPKPPSNYFMKAPNGTATMKKHVRPVSVTIGEYTAGGGRREPSKLDFLNGDKPDGPHAPNDVPITNRLQSELVMTLSRSNLRKKTETVADVSR